IRHAREEDTRELPPLAPGLRRYAAPRAARRGPAPGYELDEVERIAADLKHRSRISFGRALPEHDATTDAARLEPRGLGDVLCRPTLDCVGHPVGGSSKRSREDVRVKLAEFTDQSLRSLDDLH